MAFYWVYESAENARLGQSDDFESRSDAETWIGTIFNDLLDEAVDQVRLFDGDTGNLRADVVAPVGLHP